MDTFQAIKSRRAVKQYDPEHKLSDEQTNELFSLALESPTAFNIQNWRIVNITDIELRKQIRTAA